MSLISQSLHRGALFLALIFIVTIGSASLNAQESVLKLTQIDENSIDFTLDGRLDEAVWEQVPYFDGMRVITPDTLVPASYETHTRIFYTERGICGCDELSTRRDDSGAHDFSRSPDCARWFCTDDRPYRRGPVRVRHEGQ